MPLIHKHFDNYEKYEATLPKWNKLANKIHFAADLMWLALHADDDHLYTLIMKEYSGLGKDVIKAISNLRQIQQSFGDDWATLADRVTNLRWGRINKPKRNQLEVSFLLALSWLFDSAVSSFGAETTFARDRSNATLNSVVDEATIWVFDEALYTYESKWRLIDMLDGRLVPPELATAFSVMWPLNQLGAYAMAQDYIGLR